MADLATFPSFQQFSDLRFAGPAVVQRAAEGKFMPVMQEKRTKLTDADMTYHVWDTGRMAWYVSPFVTFISLS